MPIREKHFVIVADGGLDEDGRPVLVLAKKTPFTAAEYAAVAAHVRENPNLVWLNPTAEYAGHRSPCRPRLRHSMT